MEVGIQQVAMFGRVAPTPTEVWERFVQPFIH